MLLGIDVGNTQIVFGIYDESGLMHHWRISTNLSSTADEMSFELSGFLSLVGRSISEIDSMIISSVVPQSTFALDRMGRKVLNLEPLVVDDETDVGLNLCCWNNRQIGADRLVNAAAAVEKYGTPCIVVDFGTATTWDAIDRDRNFLGGAIAPGIDISAAALFQHAARLLHVQYTAPENPIGRDTEESLQSGIIHGTAGSVDRIVELFSKQIGEDCKVVATGGLAEIVAEECHSITHTDPLLALEGLKIIYDRNVRR